VTAITKLKKSRILEQSLEEAFPTCDPEHVPFGSRVLLQVKSAATRTASGLELTASDIETEHDNTKVAKVIAVGPGAFRNRETLELWPEGEWVKPGDFVRIGLYSGERWRKIAYTKKREIKQERGPSKIIEDDVFAHFCLLEDLALGAKFTGDPLSTVAFFQ
jgi:co-chaperonin GroES (HSP10)